MDRKIDITAPIIPWEGLGGIKLYSHIRELKELVESENTKASIPFGLFLRYDIDEKISLHFNIYNGKLYKITALEKYRGKLFDQIYIGQSIKETLELEPSLIYDDFEEVYESKKGVFIETDPITDNVLWISVFIRELYSDGFGEGLW
ncbi:hypothetical protein NE619_13715 [Anaerovorax odorimutans]|uniref:Uncharacterized protein n=1 Tax=Anaerovorax odorimutans TaxID=109327 RepID=A0ABT1RRG8_9FIRM|nr:hypothetical protein [Anaerovorax odorimutans]MCQ4637787.1 hypothetical protein [Anaerovorax odorimutans]